jgi:Ca2+-binding EF-hand superfamily protein
VEQEQEQEAEREILIEDEHNRHHSRENEKHVSWKFSALRRDATKQRETFYPLSEFHLWHREPLSFPAYLMASQNYFNKAWSGSRRIRNVEFVLEWIPSRKQLLLEDQQAALKGSSSSQAVVEALPADQLASLKLAFSLFSRGTDTIGRAAFCKIVSTMLGDSPPRAEVDALFASADKKDSKAGIQFDELLQMLQRGLFRRERKQRYFVCLSLAEGESIRRILHSRIGMSLFKDDAGNDTAVCLRHFSPGKRVVIDASQDFFAASAYQLRTTQQCFAFLNSQMYYKTADVALLVRALQLSNVRARRGFFEHVIGCRRRQARKWQGTPIARVFTLPNEYHLLKIRGKAMRMRQALQASSLKILDAFQKFDIDGSNSLSDTEMFSAFRWMGIVGVTPADVLDFIKAADHDNDGVIDYAEFLETLQDDDAGATASEASSSSDAKAAAAAAAEGGDAAISAKLEVTSPELFAAEKARRAAEEKVYLEEEAKREAALKERMLKRRKAANALERASGVFRSAGQIIFDFTNDLPMHVDLLGERKVVFASESAVFAPTAKKKKTTPKSAEEKTKLAADSKTSDDNKHGENGDDDATTTAAEKKKFDEPAFCHVQAGSHLALTLPHWVSSGGAANKKSGAASGAAGAAGGSGKSLLKVGAHRNLNRYTILLDMMVPGDMPPKESPLAIFQAQPSNKDAAECSVFHDGAVGPWAVTAPSAVHRGRQARPKRVGLQNKQALLGNRAWHVVAISVDCVAGTLRTYIDGTCVSDVKRAQEHELVVDGRFSISSKLLLFAANDAKCAAGCYVRRVQVNAQNMDSIAIEVATDKMIALREAASWTCTMCLEVTPPAGAKAAALAADTPAKATADAKAAAAAEESKESKEDDVVLSSSVCSKCKSPRFWSCAACKRSVAQCNDGCPCGVWKGQTADSVSWSCIYCYNSNAASSPHCQQCGNRRAV